MLGTRQRRSMLYVRRGFHIHRYFCSPRRTELKEEKFIHDFLFIFRSVF